MLALAAENERANNVELEGKLHKLQLTYHTQVNRIASSSVKFIYPISFHN